MPWNMPATVKTSPATSMNKTRLVKKLIHHKELVASTVHTYTYCTTAVSSVVKPCEKLVLCRPVCV